MSIDSTTIELRIAAAEDGERVDRVVSALVAILSRSQVRRLIDDGLLTVNGAAVRPSDRVSTGDTVRVDVPSEPVDDTPAAAPELPLRILHEDAAVIVLDKPAGQVVHPASGHAADTMVNALVARFPDLTEAFEGPRPGLVHRLDRDTTGVIVVARNESAAAALRAQFKARTVEKVYIALVKGLVSPLEGVIDAPIGRDAKHRKRMSALAEGREAQTHYRVLDSAGDTSLVEARPRTGRTHQIRVHFAAIGHPVAGDKVYGRRDARIARLALHAHRLSFDHPDSGERVTFEAPLPRDLRRAIAESGLRWSGPAVP